MNSRSFVLGVLCVALTAGGIACSKPAEKQGGEPAEAAKETFGRMTSPELETRMADAKAGKIKLAIYDNNQKERFTQSHIPGAKWVNFSKLQATDLPAEKDATLVFYCANEQCSACHGGATAALNLGYKNVYILPAGIGGWEKAGRPVES